MMSKGRKKTSMQSYTRLKQINILPRHLMARVTALNSGESNSGSPRNNGFAETGTKLLKIASTQAN